MKEGKPNSPDTPCQPSNETSVMPVTYFILPHKAYSPELGHYKSYGIAAYGYINTSPIEIIKDISTNGDLVFYMVWMLNKHRISTLHFKDTILDMLE